MAESGEKARRHRALLELVRKEALGSQEELGRALAGRGFEVTQATLSRDLHELKVVRIPLDEGYRYGLPEAQVDAVDAQADLARRQLGTVAALEVSSVEANEVMVVVRTLAGRASGVAVYLDSLGLADVLGTLAGDDTVLVLPRSIKKTAALMKAIGKTFGLA